MASRREIPAELRGRPFSRAEALAAGLTPKMLRHDRFTRVFPSVYADSGLQLTERQVIEAGRLSLPPDARVSHETRLRLLGLDLGPLLPLHFTVGRDLHLAVEGLCLHRTAKLPPNNRTGVCVDAALLQMAASSALIDTVAIGDWLMHRHHTTGESLAALAQTERWRPGAGALLAAIPLMHAQSRSLPESKTRCVLAAVGLPHAEVNADIYEEGEFLGCGDLVLREWRLVIEYEGRQHADDWRQFSRDIDRYAGFRRHDWEYIQVTKERLARPRALAMLVHHTLVQRGYLGPPPAFTADYHRLFTVPRVDSRP